MPPRRAINQRRAVEDDKLDWRIEQIMDARLGVALERRLDVMMDRVAERMGALMEARQEVNPRRGRVLNPIADLKDFEYDSYPEWDANIFIEEDPSDDAFVLAGGDGEPEFDEDDEGDDEGYDENWKFDEFKGNDVGVFASVKYYEDDKEADTVWEAIDKRMDSQRKDRREARLKQKIQNLEFQTHLPIVIATGPNNSAPSGPGCPKLLLLHPDKVACLGSLHGT
ncbi:hypothetical protein CDL15_Pgr018386 [Punica granatum]|uniref:PRP1 splicing factor N-terminal domain-containing protein n=1 Tax=Punica granatum TaxID=22663 RepID=A0A218W236_PUNGR|nr:hypothetical protein CDL15_Pgr018386 [Punica granatum]